MMPNKKTLTLREIQTIANIIDEMKGSRDQEGKEVTPNYTAKWDGSTQYWVGRLRGFCAPIVKRINETRDSLVKTYGTKNDNGTYTFKGDNDENFNKAIKDLLDGKDTIRFPELKASAFVKRKGDKVEEALVPIYFWEVFSDHLIMDVKEFEMLEEETA